MGTIIYPNQTEDWDQVFSKALSLAQITGEAVFFTFCELDLSVEPNEDYESFCTKVKKKQENSE